MKRIWAKGEVSAWLWFGNMGGKRLLGRARCRWEDNITMDLQEMGWGRGLDRIELAQGRNRWQDLVKRSNESSSSMKCGEFLGWLSTC